MKSPLSMLCAAAALLFCGFGAATSFARLVPLWPYDVMLVESDLVAIVEPVENQPAKDELTGHGDPARFEAVNTRFKVYGILKLLGDAGADRPKEITVLHFNHSPRANFMNGPQFIRFRIGDVRYDVLIAKGPKEAETLIKRVENPRWLVFLKRQADGRFVPVTGQFDGNLSFREIHSEALFAE